MKAVKKAITYRLLAFIVGGGTTAVFLAIMPNILIGGTTGIIAGEGVRTGLYIVHEKYWEEKEKPSKRMMRVVKQQIESEAKQ